MRLHVLTAPVADLAAYRAQRNLVIASPCDPRQATEGLVHNTGAARQRSLTGPRHLHPTGVEGIPDGRGCFRALYPVGASGRTPAGPRGNTAA